MSLNTQIHMYSVNTGHFYSNHEAYLHNLNHRCREEKNYLKNKIAFFDDVMREYGYSRQDLNRLKKGNISAMEHYVPGSADLLREYFQWHALLTHKQRKADKTKETLLTLLKNKTAQNELTNGRDHIRTLQEKDLNDTNIISVFESSLTRMLRIAQDELTDSLLVVQIYYFDIFKDLSCHGFIFHQERFRYYTSSAGQIRKKKAVFIKESLWDKYEQTIMCGLTIDRINARGGNNVNKHLAYMALTNSATDLWDTFDIDKTIVIDDFENEVTGTVDFIDESDYSITRKTIPVPIPHTDGAGMVLPGTLRKNAMFRAPWIKGLLGVFDFRRFITEHGCSPVVKDIYGTEHDLLAEDIQIIFTRSQFKMYRYYDSWDEYKACYKKYHCTAGLCNIEEDRIKNARINYQMLQTLTNITEEEMETLSGRSAQKIRDLCSDQEHMLEALGVTPYNTDPTPFQEALKRYPALLGDVYTKDILRDIKNSLVKKYRSGKLEIHGKYTFVLPDFYAACEYWFGHIPNPSGLLSDHEVFCRLFPQHETLDCLRSPHLYKEHAIRTNTGAKSFKERREYLASWYITDAVYTSTHDLISKILMFDCDGDKLLLVADRDFIRIAQRNMEDIVPLYYHMKKARPERLSHQSIYQGLHTAFVNGNIGIYSNDISKIWNSDVFLDGSAEEQAEAIDCVRLLCCENNFIIDSAKTLYVPRRPDWFTSVVTKYTRQKLPAFFAYAKDKLPEQTAPPNKSFVNQLARLIPDMPIRTADLRLPAPDYRKLMANPEIKCSREVAALYRKLNNTYRFRMNHKEEYSDNLRYIACDIRQQFTDLGYPPETIADMLVEYNYGGERRSKELLWFCFGRIIADHLLANVEAPRTKYIQCIDCGRWLEVPSSSRSRRCEDCRKAASQRKYRKYNSRRPQSTTSSVLEKTPM